MHVERYARSWSGLGSRRPSPSTARALFATENPLAGARGSDWDDFSASDPVADFDGDGMFTTFDFLAFNNVYSLGCP